MEKEADINNINNRGTGCNQSLLNLIEDPLNSGNIIENAIDLVSNFKIEGGNKLGQINLAALNSSLNE